MKKWQDDFTKEQAEAEKSGNISETYPPKYEPGELEAIIEGECQLQNKKD